MKKHAIIVAGGKGSRMDSMQPKQFLLIGGKPVLMHTLEAFHRADASIGILLVLSESYIPHWKELCEKFSFSIPHRIVTGGHERFQSVKNGLDVIEEECLIAIHDGVRPFVSMEIILASYELASKKGNAVTAVKSKDTIRYEEPGVSRSLEREHCYMVQTPQTFLSGQIKEAYAKASHSSFTDDASVLEANGGRIFINEGSYDNFKITTPEDLLLAESLLQKKEARH
jgi:2-C-methyl-D-erythritol 4-phosphate cytidylyltransferase